MASHDPLLHLALDHLPRVVVFAELARLGSFKAAAASLRLSPSTVSHHLKVLEEALQVRLVERTSRAMALTDAGRTLQAQAAVMLEAWRRGAGGARLYAEEPVGTLVVTSAGLVHRCFVVPAVTALMARYPQVRVDLRAGESYEDLHGQGIDLAVRAGRLPDSGYGARLLVEDPVRLYGTPSLVADRSWAHPSEVDEAWVHFTVGAEAPVLQGPEGETWVWQVPPRSSVDAAALKLDLALAGAGVAWFPSRLVEAEVGAGRLVPLLPGWTRGTTTFYAVTPSPRPTDAKVAQCVALLLALLAA